MTIAVFFLNRRFSDQRFLQVFLRGLGRGFLLGLFVLGLSVLFLGLAGGEAAFAQTKKKTELEAEIERLEGRPASAPVKRHYLGGGLASIGIETAWTGDERTTLIEEPFNDRIEGISLSYIYAVNQSFWMTPSYTGGSEESEGGVEISYSVLDIHALYKSPSPLFIGGGLSRISYKEEYNLFNTATAGASGFAPSVRVGVLFASPEYGALMLDYVYRGKVSEDVTHTSGPFWDSMTHEGELSVTSYQVSLSYLFNF